MSPPLICGSMTSRTSMFGPSTFGSLRIANMRQARHFLLVSGFVIPICGGANVTHSRADIPLHVSQAAVVKNETFAASGRAVDQMLRKNPEFGAHDDAPLELDDQIYSAGYGFSSLETGEQAEEVGGDNSVLKLGFGTMSVDVDSSGELAAVKPHEQIQDFSASIVEMESLDFNEWLRKYQPFKDAQKLVNDLEKTYCPDWVWKKLAAEKYEDIFPQSFPRESVKAIMRSAVEIDKIPNIMAVYEVFATIEDRKRQTKSYGLGPYSYFELVRKVVHILMKWLQWKLIPSRSSERLSFFTLGEGAPAKQSMTIENLLPDSLPWAKFQLSPEEAARLSLNAIDVQKILYYLYGEYFVGAGKPDELQSFLIKFTSSGVPDWMLTDGINRWPPETSSHAFFHKATDGQNIYIMPFNPHSHRGMSDVSGVLATIIRAQSSLIIGFVPGSAPTNQAFLMFGNHNSDVSRILDSRTHVSQHILRFVQSIKHLKFPDPTPDIQVADFLRHPDGSYFLPSVQSNHGRPDYCIRISDITFSGEEIAEHVTGFGKEFAGTYAQLKVQHPDPEKSQSFLHISILPSSHYAAIMTMAKDDGYESMPSTDTWSTNNKYESLRSGGYCIYDYEILALPNGMEAASSRPRSIWFHDGSFLEVLTKKDLRGHTSVVFLGSGTFGDVYAAELQRPRAGRPIRNLALKFAYDDSDKPIELKAWEIIRENDCCVRLHFALQFHTPPGEEIRL